MTSINYSLRALLLATAIPATSIGAASAQDATIDVERLFDGTRIIDNARMVIEDGRVVAIGTQDSIDLPAGTQPQELGSRFIMPGIVAAHSHVGTVSGTEHGGQFYSRETVARDLAQFQRYGITVVNSLGMNRPLFHELRTEWRDGSHGGADLYGAGAGVGAADGAPPAGDMGVEDDQNFRASTPGEARAAVRQMAEQGIDMVKIWVDDLNGAAPKMTPDIYSAAIEEAHALGLKAAAHIHDLDDAKGVVQAGADIVGHGVRDAEVDEEFVALLRERGTWYVPTVQINEAEYVYAENPDWLDDAFFAQGVSDDLAEQIRDKDWRAEALADAESPRAAVAMNIRNLATLHEAGINIAMGTDSGATALRIPGFAEHRELMLMAQAGMEPIDILTAATAKGADMMGLEDRGRLTEGSRADFLVLEDDPSQEISATRSLSAVWRNGSEVEK